MDREYSQFEFLSKYDQEIVIQYLGSLHLFVNLIHHLPVDNHA